MNNLAELRAFAQAHSGRVTKCRIFDANVCAWEKQQGKPWELVPADGTPLALRTASTFGSRRVEAMANPDYIALFLHADLRMAPLSVNRPDENAALFQGRFRAVDRVLLVENSRYEIFTPTGTLSVAQESLLDNVGFLNLVEALRLSGDEGLHISSDGYRIYLRSRSAELLERIVGLGVTSLDEIRDQNRADEAQQIDCLPEAFRSLAPFVRKWAIDDDVARESLIGNSDASELIRLVDALSPYMAAIDDYLDSFGDQPLDLPAMKLGRLAESVAEARRRLEVTR